MKNKYLVLLRLVLDFLPIIRSDSVRTSPPTSSAAAYILSGCKNFFFALYIVNGCLLGTKTGFWC